MARPHENRQFMLHLCVPSIDRTAGQKTWPISCPGFMPGIIQKTCQPDTGTPASPDSSAWQQSKASQSENHPPCTVRPGQVDTWARKSPKTTQGALGPLFKVFSCDLKLYRTNQLRLLQADFFVGEVTTGIFGPHVTLRPGTGTGVAIAHR